MAAFDRLAFSIPRRIWRPITRSLLGPRVEARRAGLLASTSADDAMSGNGKSSGCSAARSLCAVSSSELASARRKACATKCPTYQAVGNIALAGKDDKTCGNWRQSDPTNLCLAFPPSRSLAGFGGNCETMTEIERGDDAMLASLKRLSHLGLLSGSCRPALPHGRLASWPRETQQP